MTEKLIRFGGDGPVVKVPSQCVVCRHFMSGSSCTVFDEIPQAIWQNKADHRKPYPGDGGVQFEWATREHLAPLDLMALTESGRK